MSLEKQFDNSERALGRDLSSARSVAGVNHITDARLSFGGGSPLVTPGGPKDIPFTETLAHVAGGVAPAGYTPKPPDNSGTQRSGVNAIVAHHEGGE